MNNKTRRKVIAAYNADKYHNYRIQIYGWLSPLKDGEFSVKAFAVSDTKTYGIRVTEVFRAWTNRDYFQVKNIWKNVWGTTMVEFDEVRNRPSLSYDHYNDQWSGRIAWNGKDCFRTLFFLQYIRWQNADEVMNDSKYRYCAWNRYHGTLSLIEYAKMFAEFPEVELLSKAELSRFVNRRFLKTMANNDGLKRFFRNNIELLRKVAYDINDVIRANRNGWTLEHASDMNRASYVFRKFPKQIDKAELMKYLRKNDIDEYDYTSYYQDVKRAEMNILDYGVTYPRDFHAMRKRVHNRIKKLQRIAEAERKRQEAEREENIKKIATRINSLLEKMHNRLAWRVKDYDIIVPTTRKQFTEEGNVMHNCISGYYDRCAEGATCCFFIRKGGSPHADVEINPNTGKVLQCRTMNNGSADDETKGIAKAIGERIAKMRKVA